MVNSANLSYLAYGKERKTIKADDMKIETNGPRTRTPATVDINNGVAKYLKGSSDTFILRDYQGSILEKIASNDGNADDLTANDIKGLKPGKKYTVKNTGAPGIFSSAYYKLDEEKSDVKKGIYVVKLYDSSTSYQGDTITFDLVTDEEKAKAAKVETKKAEVPEAAKATDNKKGSNEPSFIDKVISAIGHFLDVTGCPGW